MHSITAWLATLTALRAMSIAAAALNQPAYSSVQVHERGPGILPAALDSILQPLAILTVATCLDKITSTSTVAISSPCTLSAVSTTASTSCASETANTPDKPTPTSADDNDNQSMPETAGSKQHCGECKSVTIKAHTETVIKASITETCLQSIEPSVIPAVNKTIARHNLTSSSTTPCSSALNTHNSTSTQTPLPTRPAHLDDSDTSSASNAVLQYGYSALSLILVAGMAIIVWVTNADEL